MADPNPEQTTSPPALSHEIERRVVDAVMAEHRAGTVVRKDLIRWFAENLLKGDEGNPRPGERIAAITPAYIEDLILRFPGLSSVLRIPPHPTPKPLSLETEKSQAAPLKGVALMKELKRKKRLEELYGDNPPPRRQPSPYPEGEILYHIHNRYAVRHGDVITKYNTSDEGMGPFDRPNEAVALEFVKEHTTIPVPTLISSDWDRVTMDFVEGRNLQEAWPALSPDERNVILEELRGYIRQLRQLSGSVLSRLDGQGVLVQSIMTRSGGPFNTMTEFHDWLVMPPKRSGARSMYWHQITAQLGNDFPIIFTHGDIAARNIIIDKGHIVAILDWECAGWYPEYWEYVFAMQGMDKVDWETLGCHLPSLFDKRFDLEYILMQFILSLS